MLAWTLCSAYVLQALQEPLVRLLCSKCTDQRVIFAVLLYLRPHPQQPQELPRGSAMAPWNSTVLVVPSTRKNRKGRLNTCKRGGTKQHRTQTATVMT